MNVFMPCESILESTKSLDDKRLIKQIIECKIMLDDAISYSIGEKESGYFKHPVCQYYKDYPIFLARYGLSCCAEYKYRFKKNHRLSSYFYNLILTLRGNHLNHLKQFMYPAERIHLNV